LSINTINDFTKDLKINDKKTIFPLIEEIFHIYNKVEDEDILNLATNFFSYFFESELKESNTIINCESFTLKCVITSDIEKIKTKILPKIENSLTMIKENNDNLDFDGFLERFISFINHVEKIQNYSDQQEDFKAEACMRIMNHFLDLNNFEIYFTYIHILSKMHEGLKNYVESGLALQLHSYYLR
jgi:hypothetical protein